MQSRTSLSSFFMDEEPTRGENLQNVFFEAICQHRSLVGDMGATLRRLGLAIAESNLDADEKLALVAGIDRHVENARDIVASIDRALSIATVNSATSRH